MNVIIYDLEIVNCVPPKGGAPLPGLSYCNGWHDHKGMGVAVLGVYDYGEDRSRVFCADNRDAWGALLSRKPLCVGFNSSSRRPSSFVISPLLIPFCTSSRRSSGDWERLAASTNSAAVMERRAQLPVLG